MLMIDGCSRKSRNCRSIGVEARALVAAVAPARGANAACSVERSFAAATRAQARRARSHYCKPQRGGLAVGANERNCTARGSEQADCIGRRNDPPIAPRSGRLGGRYNRRRGGR
jgi:hypothetical protein